LLKVLQIPQSSNYWYQRALLTDELSEIFSAAPPPPQLRGSFIANQNVVGAWREATGRGPTLTHTKSSISDDSRRIPASGDDCPICYDKMNDEGLDLSSLEKILEWCNSCHNPVHKECWIQWRTTKQRQDQSLTCVYCRSGWIGNRMSFHRQLRTFSQSFASHYLLAGGVGGSSEEGFLNLARFSGVSTVRDTSTCLSFPLLLFKG
ncbi:hypothetical protein DFJ43DRAFT_1001967, partial [Lentinula guzmanii]